MDLYSKNSTINNNNQSQNSDSEVIFYTLITVFLYAVGFWIIVTNIMIIYAPFVNSALKKKTCIFISSLAMADIFTAFCVPGSWTILYFKTVNRSYFFKIATDMLCKFRLAMMVFPLQCSITNLFLISVDRFIAIVFPLKYDVILTRRVAYICCLCAWLFSSSIALIILGWARYYDIGGDRCEMINISPVYVHCLGAVFSVFVIIMLGIYSKIYLILMKSARQASTRRIGSRQASRTENRMAKMVFISLGIFLACWGPFFVIFQLYVEFAASKTLFYIFCAISYCNSGMNFLIYARRSYKYRNAFRTMFRTFIRKKNTPLAVTSTPDHSYSANPAAKSTPDHSYSGSPAAKSTPDHSYSDSPAVMSTPDHSYSGNPAVISTPDHSYSDSPAVMSTPDHSYSDSPAVMSTPDHSYSGQLVTFAADHS